MTLLKSKNMCTKGSFVACFITNNNLLPTYTRMTQMWFVMKLMISAYDNTALGNISRLTMVNNGHNVF